MKRRSAKSHLSHGKKALLCGLLCLLILVFVWSFLGFPALTPDWAFKRACRASFLPVMTPDITIAGDSTSGEVFCFCLAEEGGTVYAATARRGNRLDWRCEVPLYEYENVGQDGLYIVLLPAHPGTNSGPHAAVRSPGESAELELLLESDTGTYRQTLISCGRQGEWLLFRFDTELLEHPSSVQPDSPESSYFLFLSALPGCLRPDAGSINGLNACSLHLTAYDADGKIVADAAQTY